jgi:hypothetical protein
METILNLAWLAVTMAAIWLWRYRWIPSRQNPRHNPRQETIAIVCFIALAFPVISLTDDLHPEILAADAAGSKRHSCLLISAAHHTSAAGPVAGTHFAVGMLPGGLAPVRLAAWESVSVATRRNPDSFAGSSAGRSPPYLL